MGNLSRCVILLCLALQVLATKSVVTFGDKFSYNGPSMLRNGRVWPEYLASMVGATWRSSIDTQDTAGGFKSVENQVLVYCRSRDIDAHALHTLWVGVDDLVGSFISGFEAIKGGKNVSSLLETLYGCGGRKFLVLGVPAIHYMPLIRRSSGVNENRIEEFKQQILTYNIDLEDTVNVFAASKADAITHYFDVYSLSNRIISNPPPDLCNVADACYHNGVVCKTPDCYLWWDEYFFTTHVENIIANDVYNRMTSGDLNKYWDA